MKQQTKLKHFFLLTFVFLLFTTSIRADEFIVKSFKKIDNKILTNDQKVYDDNDELCAIILVRTSLVELGVSCSTPIVGNVKWVEGDYKVHVSAGTRMIKFFKKGFETLEYTFSQSPEKGSFYLLELEYRRTDAATVGNTMGFVVIESEPSGASVWIENKESGETTPFSRPFNEGYYRFSLKKGLYHDFEGEFTITANQNTELKFALKPNYGSLEVKSLPENGAEIFIDNVNTGKQTPGLIDFITAGDHQLSLRKAMYETYTADFKITDAKKTLVEASLSPAFGTIEIEAGAGDEIYIDRQKIATGSYSGRLSRGQHLLEVKKQNHYPETLSLTVEAGQNIKKAIALRAITGILSVNSNPIRADIYLNKNLQGQSPMFINELMVGSYTLKLEKTGHATIEKKIEITENQTTTINETLPSTIQVEITSKPTGARLYVDDVYIGITPQTVLLSFESHSFKLQKEDYKELQINKTITTKTNKIQLELEVIAPQTITSSVAGIELVFVKGGTYTMGCTSEQGSDCSGDEKPAHQVTVSDYYIGKYEVTQAQWQAIMGNNPSYNKNCDNCPVERVSWNDIQKFIKKLNQKTGKNYRLPTEAEWEYAARGGNQSKGYKYTGSNMLGDVGWYDSNSGSKTHPVGQKKANELGIYDMSGNVWEWCNDWYGDYSSSSQRNPQGASSGLHRVLRGGCWSINAGFCRVSYRIFSLPDNRYNDLGFRLVVSL